MTRKRTSEMGDGGQGLFVDAEVLKQMIEILVRQVLEAELENYIGAGFYERSEQRRGHRNGTKPRTMKTRIGDLHFEVPQVREGGFYPSAFERYQRSEKALVCAIQEMVVQGVSTRDVKKVMEEMGGFEVSAATVSRAMAELDEEIRRFRTRRLVEHEYPYLIVDARYERVRREGHVRPSAVLIVAGITEEGRREILGYYVGDSESEATWGAVFRDLKDRGVSGIRMVVSDAHKGIRAALARHFQGVSWQRCQVHFMREMLKKASWKDYKELSADLRAVFVSEKKEQCLRTSEEIAQKWEKRYPSLARAIREGVEDCLTVQAMPAACRKRLRSTNMLECVMREMRRRTRVVNIFPNEASCVRLFGALLIELNEQWLIDKRAYLNGESDSVR
jgi:putative transposase